MFDSIQKIGTNFELFKNMHEENFGGLAERMDKLEALGDRPKAANGSKGLELKTAIDRFFRRGDKSGLAPYQSGYEGKEMTIGTDSAGGYTHVPELADEILAAIGEAVPMFADVRKETTDSNEYRQIYTTNAPSAARAAESGTRSATTTPLLARVDVSLFDLYAYASVTNELLDSSQFNVSSYLQGEIQRQFEAAIETEIVSGSGSGSQQALGILTQATSDVAEGASPERSFALYQRLDLGINSPVSSFNYSSLVQLSQTLPVRYRRNAKFYASTGAVQPMRQLVDSQSRPIWLDSTGGVSGSPQSILGYQVIEAPAMPTVASGNLPVVFGDLSQAYLWVTHMRGLRVIRDDVTTPGTTKFYASLQCGGMPGDTRALKALRVAE